MGNFPTDSGQKTYSEELFRAQYTKWMDSPPAGEFGLRRNWIDPRNAGGGFTYGYTQQLEMGKNPGKISILLGSWLAAVEFEKQEGFNSTATMPKELQPFKNCLPITARVGKWSRRQFIENTLIHELWHYIANDKGEETATKIGLFHIIEMQLPPYNRR